MDQLTTPSYDLEKAAHALLAVDLDATAEAMLPLEQAKIKTRHIFGPGVYAREMSAPADTIIIGYVHKEDCINTCSAGTALVRMDDDVFYVTAPSTFVSKAGSRKAVLVIRDLVWTNYHAADTTDLAKLEERLYHKPTILLKKEETCPAGL